MIINNLDLRILLNEKGITQKAIANDLKVSPMTVNRWFNTPKLDEERRTRILKSVSRIEKKQSA